MRLHRPSLIVCLLLAPVFAVASEPPAQAAAEPGLLPALAPAQAACPTPPGLTAASPLLPDPLVLPASCQFCKYDSNCLPHSGCVGECFNNCCRWTCA
jgi:hypothetical protein